MQTATIRGADWLLFRLVSRSRQNRKHASLLSWRREKHLDLVLDAVIKTSACLTTYLQTQQPQTFQECSKGRLSPPSSLPVLIVERLIITYWDYSCLWRNSNLVEDQSAKILNDAFMQGVMAKSCIHFATGQEFIVTDENRVRLCMSNWKERIEAKRGWYTPLSLTVTLGFGLAATASFRDLFGFSKDVIQAAALIAFLISLGWLVFRCACPLG
jgi:hypothetical protein